MIRSDPPGAAVVVNGKDAGLTPVEMNFETYGDFDVLLSAPGHHRVNRAVPVDAPWFQQIPIDFVTEMLWPFTIHDRHEIMFTLQPFPESDDAAVNEREGQLRQYLEVGTSVPEPDLK